MTREFSITFGVSNSGPIISSMTALGPGVSREKVQDLRQNIIPAPEEVSIEGQIRAEDIFNQITINGLGQEKTGDFLSLGTPYFSHLWVGQDRNHNVSLGFVFDIKSFMKKNVVFPTL